MLKIARSQEYGLEMGEQVEAITVRLRDRLRQSYVINPLTEYLLKSEPKEILKELVETENSLVRNDEGIRMHEVD
jgi:hypothetical protein